MEAVLEFLRDADRVTVVHYGFLFLVAAFIHAKQVRKEIALQFTAVSAALNNVADALKQDLAKHSQRLDNIEKDVTVIKSVINQKQGEK